MKNARPFVEWVAFVQTLNPLQKTSQLMQSSLPPSTHTHTHAHTHAHTHTHTSLPTLRSSTSKNSSSCGAGFGTRWRRSSLPAGEWRTSACVCALLLANTFDHPSFPITIAIAMTHTQPHTHTLTQSEVEPCGKPLSCFGGSMISRVSSSGKKKILHLRTRKCSSWRSCTASWK